MFHNWASDAKVTKYLTWAAYQYEHEVKERLRFREKRYQNKEMNRTGKKRLFISDRWAAAPAAI